MIKNTLFHEDGQANGCIEEREKHFDPMEGNQ